MTSFHHLFTHTQKCFLFILFYLDSLSLSLFEALRGLRDSVAPESTNNENIDEHEHSIDGSGNANATKKSPIDLDMDYDDFLLAYHRDNPVALEFIAMANNKPPKTRDEYTKLRAKFAGIRASELMSKLAGNILNRSAAVHDLVEDMTNRTKAEQMERISELIEQNKKAEEGLQEAFEKAESRRNKLRSILDEVTCKSLGISEEN
jgi:hypothetical protein